MLFWCNCFVFSTKMSSLKLQTSPWKMNPHLISPYCHLAHPFSLFSVMQGRGSITQIPWFPGFRLNSSNGRHWEEDWNVSRAEVLTSCFWSLLVSVQPQGRATAIMLLSILSTNHMWKLKIQINSYSTSHSVGPVLTTGCSVRHPSTSHWASNYVAFQEPAVRHLLQNSFSRCLAYSWRS